MPTIPRATYRMQLNSGFPFAAAAAVAGYLADLGVSHLYTSPILRSTPGSTHGYDVVDPTVVDDELGGRAGYERLSDRLRLAGLGHVLDVVPNHMAATPENPWWRDVLARGEASPYARFFDIDWEHGEEVAGKVLVPVLARPLEAAVEAGEVRLERDPGDSDALVVACAGQRLPVVVEEDERRTLAAAVDAGGPASGELLDLLARQSYLLAHWRRVRALLNYRRFFTITSLVGVRVGDPEVFRASHATVVELVREGRVDGLRVDHPDGLRDPETYLERLTDASGGAWTVVEKILEPGEDLPPRWPVAGTTGYDFMAAVGGLLVDPEGEAPLTALYAEVTGEETRFEEVAHRAKLEVARGELAPEIERLTDLVLEAHEERRRAAEHGEEDGVGSRRASAEPPSGFLLSHALVELLACFPVYRTYVRPDTGGFDDRDAHAVATAHREALRRRPELAAALDALAGLLLSGRDGAAGELVWRFQQASGPVMAKAVEDRAFYRYHRLAAACEVGADPGRFAVSPEEVHAFFEERQASWPGTLNALTTHDTKRSADVRARLYLLSEIPEEWSATVRRWARRHRRYRHGDWPDGNVEYLLYQTLLGAYPLPRERAWAYLEKAAREAAVHTSWTRPDAEYEKALAAFLDDVLADPETGAELAELASRLTGPGRVGSLAQALLAATAPGVPDVYQGDELWNLSLVDPDNRRPVDYEARRAALDRLLELAASGAAGAIEEILDHDDEGWPKLWTVHRALDLRGRRPELFSANGRYRRLWARGPLARHLFAFARLGPGADPLDPEAPAAVTCVPRLTLRLGGDWRGAVLPLPPGRWRDLLGGASYTVEPAGEAGAVEVARLLARFPVALLEREPASGPSGAGPNPATDVPGSPA